MLLPPLRGELGSATSSVLSSLLSEKSPSNGQYVRQRAVYGHVINLMVAGGGEGAHACPAAAWQAGVELQAVLPCLPVVCSQAQHQPSCTSCAQQGGKWQGHCWLGSQQASQLPKS